MTTPAIQGPFVIYDTERGGYANDDLIEGWIFTILLSAAKRFDTYEAARAVADKHYNPGRKIRVAIIPAAQHEKFQK